MNLILIATGPDPIIFAPLVSTGK